VSVANPDGSPVIITEVEAERLVGRDMWPLYKKEFEQLPKPVTVVEFRSHAQSVLQHLVVTGKLSLALDVHESGSHLSEDRTMNMKIIPCAEENLTVVKKKRRKKSMGMKTPKRVLMDSASGNDEEKEVIDFEAYQDADVEGVAGPVKIGHSKKSQILGVTEKGRKLVEGVESMSEENQAKIRAYKEHLKAQEEAKKSKGLVASESEPMLSNVNLSVLSDVDNMSSKESLIMGVSSKARMIVEGPDVQMSAENQEKVQAYKAKLLAEQEGRPTPQQEKVLREKKVLIGKLGNDHASSKGSLVLGVNSKARLMVAGPDVQLSDTNRSKVQAHQEKLAAEQSGLPSPRTQKVMREKQAIARVSDAKPSKRSMILGVNTKARDLVGDSGGALSPEHLKKIQAHKEKLRAEDEARINEIKERLRREGHSEKDVEARFSNPFHESVTVNDLLDLRSTYMQADEKEQEALIEQMLIELDRICQQVASRHGIAAGDMITDKDGCWDEDPLSLVPDIVKMGWDFVHTGDVEVHNETSDGGDMYATAIRLFSIANALVETEHADVLCGLGISISDIGYHDKAIELLETSRHLAPNNHITLLYLGMVYFENEQLEEAAEILEPAIRYCAKANDHHHLEEALRKRGNAFEELGDYKSAAKNYAIAMELEPNEPTFFSARALCLKELGLYAKAATTFQTAATKYAEHGDDEAEGQCLEEMKACKEVAIKRKAEKAKAETKAES